MALQQQQMTVEAIRLLMGVRQLTLTAVAQQVRKPKPMSRSNLHAYLRDDEPQKITLDLLEELARILDVPTWLLMQERAEVMRWLGENPNYGVSSGEIPLRPLCLTGVN